MKYFKSYFTPGLAYSPNWYGTMPYAPPATVLLYNDNDGYCIGYMEAELPLDVLPMTEYESKAEVAAAMDADGVYFGDKLVHRWDEQAGDV